MIALVLAAQVAAAPPGELPRTEAPMPNLYSAPARCKDVPYKVVDRFGRPVATRLGDLPRGGLYYAVERRVNGCPVLVVVYGDPARDDPNPPPSAHKVLPLAPGRAH
jgi:hypothetical protein